MSGCKHHEEPEILSVMPAQPGWGLATLWTPYPDQADLYAAPIVAWATVRVDASRCQCSETMVVPMTPTAGELRPQFPEPASAQVQTLIIAPGMKPVATRQPGGGHSLIAVPGAWLPGEQPAGDGA